LDDDDLDEILRALAHPARRTFLRACLTKARAAGDLSALSDLSLATVSEHLKVLRKTGLLQLDRRGRFWMYRTDAALLEGAALAIRKLGDR
jgi:DNA-binding transcriptional ArsR family regulator